MSLTRTIDIGGVYGSALNYGMVIFFVGSALMIFIYLWRIGRLSMDEDAKMQMMKDDDTIEDSHERRK